MGRYHESKVPDHLKVHVRRFTSDDHYITRCDLIDTDTGDIMASAESRCHPSDQPNRKIGRAIAVGRALRTYREGAPGSLARVDHQLRRVARRLS